MEQYHGTNAPTATLISSGHIDVAVSGGELGQGFYTGDLSYEAFNWAYIKYKQDMAVVKLTLDDDDFISLNPLCFDSFQTCRYRKKIRDRGLTRTFKFGVDVVWAPVVGKLCSNFNQFKYESKKVEMYLNGSTVIKTRY